MSTIIQDLDGTTVLKVIETKDKAIYKGLAKARALRNVLDQRLNYRPSQLLNIYKGLDVLENNYNNRQKRLQESNLIYFTKGTISGIGFVPLIPVAVGTALRQGTVWVARWAVPVAIAWAVWWYFKPDAQNAEKDYAYFESIYPKLKTFYEALPDDKKQDFQTEMERFGNNEFERGKSQTPLSFAKSGFYVLLGLYLLKQLKT